MFLYDSLACMCVKCCFAWVDFWENFIFCDVVIINAFTVHPIKIIKFYILQCFLTLRLWEISLFTAGEIPTPVLFSKKEKEQHH